MAPGQPWPTPQLPGATAVRDSNGGRPLCVSSTLPLRARCGLCMAELLRHRGHNLSQDRIDEIRRLSRDPQIYEKVGQAA